MQPRVKDYTFYQIPLPPRYRKLSRRRRLVIELSVGVAVLLLFSIAVSMQMPVWLQLAGWAAAVVYWAAWCVIVLERWGRRQARGRYGRERHIHS